MKRSRALIPLSRDHHRALEIALRLRRATGDDVEEAADLFAVFWADHGRRHFAIEEELLLPALPASDVQWQAATERVRGEHEEVRRLTADLARANDERTAIAHALGALLHDHVRFEERDLFAQLEAGLEAAALDRLGCRVQEAEDRPDG